MTPSERRALARHRQATAELAHLRRTVADARAKQGLPPTVEDPATLARCAALIRAGLKTARARESGAA